jgi:hypothetical protein
MPNDAVGEPVSTRAAVISNLPRRHYGVIYADPPLRFKTYDNASIVSARGTRMKPPRCTITR